jgi:hypothetical protein
MRLPSTVNRPKIQKGSGAYPRGPANEIGVPLKYFCIASGMAKLQPRTGPNRQPDAMRRKHRNGRGSTKTSVENEIKHLRGAADPCGRNDRSDHLTSSRSHHVKSAACVRPT